MPGVFFTAMDGGGCRKCRSIFARHGWRTCRPLSAIHGLRGTWAPARRKCRMHFSARPALDGRYAGLSRPSMASAGRSRPSLAFAALGPCPSHSGSSPSHLGSYPAEMQEHFCPPWMADMPASLGHPWPPRHLGSCPAKMQDAFFGPARIVWRGYRPLSAIHGLRGPLTAILASAGRSRPSLAFAALGLLARRTRAPARRKCRSIFARHG
jgi:hypothetical protein